MQRARYEIVQKKLGQGATLQDCIAFCNSLSNQTDYVGLTWGVSSGTAEGDCNCNYNDAKVPMDDLNGGTALLSERTGSGIPVKGDDNANYACYPRSKASGTKYGPLSGECLDSNGDTYDYVRVSASDRLEYCVYTLCDYAAPRIQDQVGISWDKSTSTCYCHYSNGTLPPDDEFDYSDFGFEVNRTLNGTGPVFTSNGRKGTQCFPRKVRTPSKKK